jgi:hypothetical protein
MRPGREGLLRIGLQLDDRELQLRRGGLGGFLVLGAEPRGLGQLGAAGGAVDQDGGQRVWVWLGWGSHLMLLESVGTPLGSRC